MTFPEDRGLAITQVIRGDLSLILPTCLSPQILSPGQGAVRWQRVGD